MSWLSNPAGNIDVGRKTVTAAATAEALSTSNSRIISVVIQALPSNTNEVVVGDSSVVAAVGTRKGLALNPGESLVLNIDQLSDVYLDVETNGEGVSYLALVP
jgi:hypothetical protein